MGRKGGKKAPDQVTDERKTFSRQDKSNTFSADSQSLINQDYMDLVEADPEEPEDKNIRGKFWCFVLYPESVPENWQEILDMSGVKYAVSPLHDKDLNADLTPKKPHYHVILIWTADTTYNNVANFTHKTLNATYPQKLCSPVGYYKYFTHEDNPEKAPYSKKDIITGNGFDIAEYRKMTREQMLEMHMMLTQQIIDNHICDYFEAVQMAMSMGFEEYDMVTSHTYHFAQLCKSIKYKCCVTDERS